LLDQQAHHQENVMTDMQVLLICGALVISVFIIACAWILTSTDRMALEREKNKRIDPDEKSFVSADSNGKLHFDDAGDKADRESKQQRSHPETP
jgi:hypothetical protein